MSVRIRENGSKQRVGGGLKRRVVVGLAATAASLGLVFATAAPAMAATELGGRNCWPNGAPKMYALTKADTTWGTTHFQRWQGVTRSKVFVGGVLVQYTQYDAGWNVVDRGAIEVNWPGVVYGAVLGCH
ncbi:hypothetical protein [Agromyces laixinhei]|uniref:hypothetical protein n=1 Tax=Agromyces laixinhei TaxID=2585717 RepID=UPI0012ED5B40|nr:hypothetical protein [Agromyces laixinhei]